jgi:hypothetical protein
MQQSGAVRQGDIMADINRRLARNTLDISDSQLAAIISLARDFETFNNNSRQGEALPSRQPLSPGASPDGDAAGRKLKAAIHGLSEDQQAVLFALARIGQGAFEPGQFDAAIVEAFHLRSKMFAEQIADVPRLAAMLEAGSIACGAHPDAISAWPPKRDDDPAR